MAKSPSHRFGQIIGNLLEEIIQPFLQEFVTRNGYYLDKAGERGGARPGKKVKWVDKYGNSHDLDFVIEADASADEKGRPLAFIEAAWRRYTKHSRNKAQEIQGAILPIAEHYSWDAPFLGAIIAGIFTKGSIEQMKSVGFTVLYIPYDSIVSSFREVGIDVAFDESTPDKVFERCLDHIELLTPSQWEQLKGCLVSINQSDIDVFMEKLAKVLERSIAKIIVIPLFGRSHEFISVADAKVFLNGNFAQNPENGLKKIEVIVEYNNGDRIEGSFKKVDKASEFLDYVHHGNC